MLHQSDDVDVDNRALADVGEATGCVVWLSNSIVDGGVDDNSVVDTSDVDVDNRGGTDDGEATGLVVWLSNSIVARIASSISLS